jgi:hypothetical protein
VVRKQSGRAGPGSPATGEPRHPVPVRQAAASGLARANSAGWRLALLTSGFAVLGVCLLLVADDATAGSHVYTSTPEFKVWATLATSLIASLPSVWRVGVDLLRRLDLEPRRVLRSQAVPALIAVVLVVAAAVLAGAYLGGGGSPYYGGPERVGAIYLLAVTAVVPTFVAMWECYRLLGTDAGRQDNASEVNRLLTVRECLLSALATVGLLVSAGVLATGAQRQAALTDPRHTVDYPSAYVLIWGLAFSALLVVNFLPAFRRLMRRANETIDALFPIISPGSDGWQARLQERKDLADLLKVTSGAKDVITSSILVAGPLISSAFSLFLPGPPPG